MVGVKNSEISATQFKMEDRMRIAPMRLGKWPVPQRDDADTAWHAYAMRNVQARDESPRRASSGTVVITAPVYPSPRREAPRAPPAPRATTMESVFVVMDHQMESFTSDASSNPFQVPFNAEPCSPSTSQPPQAAQQRAAAADGGRKRALEGLDALQRVKRQRYAESIDLQDAPQLAAVLQRWNAAANGGAEASADAEPAEAMEPGCLPVDGAKRTIIRAIRQMASDDSSKRDDSAACVCM